MLTQFSIRDYVLVDKLDLEFGKGLNIITGETGAGKSIIVEALLLLLGDRAKTDVIRTNKEKAIIQGTFSLGNNKSIIKYFKEQGVDIFNDEIMIRREIVNDGKNRCFINGMPSTLQIAKAIGELLVDFHGQNEHQSLFKPENHLSFLDSYTGIEKDLTVYSEIFHKFKDKKELLSNLILKEKSITEKKDFLLHQFNELKSSVIYEGREKELLSRIHYLEGGRKAKDLLNEIATLLNNDLSARFLRAQKPLEKLAEIDSGFADRLKTFNEIRIFLNDLISSFPDGSSDEKADEWNLDDLNSQLSVISKLKRKYNRDEACLLSLMQETKKDLDFLENTVIEKEDLEKEISYLEKDLIQKSELISQLRKKAATKLELKVLYFLKQMNMDHAILSISFSRKEQFDSDGLDIIQFMFSANPGEPVRPLSKIASGGEISRVMLAIKSVLAEKDKTPVLIFDEIDAGIGGITSEKVGLLLKDLSKYHQIFCITHSHQIAKEADIHFSVDKKISANHTSITMKILEEEDRIKEISRMLGGINSKTARTHAESLIRR